MAVESTLFLTGATGLLGTSLLQRWSSAGHTVRALSRREGPVSPISGVDWISGDIVDSGTWQRAVDGVDAVVHLAGEPVAAARWTSSRKSDLRSSRIEGTARLVEAIAGSERPPAVLVCASATGYYGAGGEAELDENSPPGNDFLAELARDWEASAQAAAGAGTRVVRLRFGTLLSRDGGALSRMLPIFRSGLGGPMGGGGNFVPWLHVDDAMGLVDWALAEHEVSGAVNAVSPVPIRMREFARILGRVVRRPAILPVPLVLMKLALGELGEALFPGQRVMPRVALERGYVFQHEALDGALASLLD